MKWAIAKPQQRTHRPRSRRIMRSRRLALATGRAWSPAIWLTALFVLMLLLTACAPPS